MPLDYRRAQSGREDAHRRTCGSDLTQYVCNVLLKGRVMIALVNEDALVPKMEEMSVVVCRSVVFDNSEKV